MGGSKIIFPGPSKVFTQANKKQQRESSHVVNSLIIKDYLIEPTDYNNIGSLGWILLVR